MNRIINISMVFAVVTSIVISIAYLMILYLAQDHVTMSKLYVSFIVYVIVIGDIMWSGINNPAK
jgi:hypothetical protein